MGSERDTLRAAISARAIAREALADIAAAVNHGQDALDALEAQKADLDAAERRRSEGLAERMVQAIKAGAMSPIGSTDSDAKQRRLARLEVEDGIATATSVLADLRAKHAEAEAEAASRQQDLDAARHAVAKLDALELAACLLKARADTEILARRLILYTATLPMVSMGQGLGGYAVKPPEVSQALDQMDRYTPSWFQGKMDPQSQAEDDAWRGYLAALDVDPDAQPTFPV